MISHCAAIGERGRSAPEKNVAFPQALLHVVRCSKQPSDTIVQHCNEGVKHERRVGCKAKGSMDQDIETRISWTMRLITQRWWCCELGFCPQKCYGFEFHLLWNFRWQWNVLDTTYYDILRQLVVECMERSRKDRLRTIFIRYSFLNEWQAAEY